MTVAVPLTKGFVAIVDDADAPAVLAAGPWHASVKPWTTYARRTVRRPDGKRVTLLLHTFLTGWSRVDHRNNDGLDNRRINLRPATDRQNGANAKLSRANSSGYKGVSWHRVTGRWVARIVVDRRWIHLGLFDDPSSAARAYDEAARHHFGEFAWLNFPDA